MIEEHSVYARSARLYDALYAFKDYASEAQRLHLLIQQRKGTDGCALLDVACGTGGHVLHLRQHYDVEGLDLEPAMLAVARERYPEVPFHQGDMTSFDLGRQFDVVVCLFGSIGYTKTAPKLQQAISSMRSHLRPGGVLIVEPWLTPDRYQAGRLYAQFVDQPDLKIARMNVSKVENGLSILDFHYLVGTQAGIEYLTERHELGLFTDNDYRHAFASAGLAAMYIDEGLATVGDRGLYLALVEP